MDNRDTEDKLRDYLKRATAELGHLRHRLKLAEDSVSEPIAIIGMACRLPGGINSPEDLWRLLDEGRDAVAPFPADRGWDLDGGDGDYCQEAALLPDVADFDAGFFGIAPREALSMDPQQRLMLETSWEAIEEAGIDARALEGRQVGVFTGAMDSGYITRLDEALETIKGYQATGSIAAMVSGRVAYHLGLEGPAISIDTACSSSLTSLHLAIQSLRNGNCDMALAGGVVVLPSMMLFEDFARQGGLAADGRIKAFSATADGTNWSEGAGVLLVERLSDARRNKRRIHAVLRGSAINQDGASNGMTAPNDLAQERVIKAALADARLGASDVDAVEAHGTGTTLGDPLEAKALLASYGRDRPEDRPLWLGAVKSNLGHSGAAAGVTGVIKMVQAMRHGILPKTLNVDEPNPNVDWSSGGVELLTEAREWKVDGRPRRAGVSGFGASGTNAHVIVEEAPTDDTDIAAGPPETESSLPAVMWPVSGTSKQALRAQAERLLTRIEHHDQLSTCDVGYTLATARVPFAERAVVVGDDIAAQRSGLQSIAAGTESPHTVHDSVSDGSVAFLFTGQGSQRLGMGRELYETYPAFASVFDEVCEHLDPQLGRPLREVVFGDDPDLVNRASYAQPALFAVEVALFRLFETWGIAPDYLNGHSIGELSAAHVAGVFSLADACTLVAARGRLMQGLPDDTVGVTEVEKLDTFRDVAKRLTYHPPRIPIVSNVTGAVAAGQEMCTAEFWVRHFQQTVRFAEGARALAAAGVSTFIELGPDGALCAEVADCLDDEALRCIPVLRPQQSETQTLALAVARAHARGVAIDWNEYYAGTGAQRVSLPTYAFQRQRFWAESATTPGKATPGAGAAEHALLGEGLPLADSDEWLFTGRLSAKTLSWLPDPGPTGDVLLPGAAFVDMAWHAGAVTGCPRIEELTLREPLLLPAEGDAEVQVIVQEPDEAGARAFTVYGRVADEPNAGWSRYAQGSLASTELGGGGPLLQWPPDGTKPVDVSKFHDRLCALGLGGPDLRCLTAAWHGKDELYYEISATQEQVGEAGRYGIHPLLLNAVTRGWALAGDLDALNDLGDPRAWRGLELFERGETALRARVRHDAERLRDVTLFDQNGRMVATLDAVELGRVTAQPESGVEGKHADLMTVEWVPLDDPVHDAPHWAYVPASAETFAELPDPAPKVAVVRVDDRDAEVSEIVTGALAMLQAWLAEDRYSESLLAFAVRGDGPVQAAVAGLVRSAAREHPGRFGLLHPDIGYADCTDAAAAALRSGEPEIRMRDRDLAVPRLKLRGRHSALRLPRDGRWRLGAKGTSGCDVLPSTAATVPLEPRQVRVDVAAAGLNLSDLETSSSRTAGMGLEGAGVVTEVGSDVTDLAVGDRVMGMMRDSMAPVAVTDRRELVRLPDGLNFSQGASIPVAFLTGWISLVDVAALKPGERVLIHAGTGGAGLAAIQIARYLGAEVFATASPSEQHLLREVGLDGAHIASSHTLDFRDHFMSITNNQEVDVVLNTLPGKFTDATLELLGRGGRFIELGKTDVGDASALATSAGVRYEIVDLDSEQFSDRVEVAWQGLVELFEAGELRPPLMATVPINRAPEVTNQKEAAGLKKIVFTVPQPWDTDKTVLITGGTGMVGGLLARHLVTRHGVRHLVLASRRGLDAEGAADLKSELEAEGTSVKVVSCDVGDRDSVRRLLAEVPQRHPLGTVIHAAAIVDDAVVTDLTPGHVERVLRAKADSAAHLDELTAGMPLDNFILFSSGAGTIGAPGQANYAASSACLDGLARDRRRRGLPAISVAWGMWKQASGMTGHLGQQDLARVERTGIAAIGNAEGMALFDAAVDVDEPLVVAVKLAHQGLRQQSRAKNLPAILTALTPTPVKSLARRPHRVADAAESRFWQAVEHGDLDSLAAMLRVGVDQPLSSVLPALTSWRRWQRDAPMIDKWRYRVAWRPADLGGDAPTLSGRWILVVPSQMRTDSWTSGLLRAVGEHGADTVQLTVDPSMVDHDELAGQLRKALSPGEGEAAIDGVLSLLAFDETPDHQHPTVTAGTTATIVLGQALAAVNSEARLWIFTRGAAVVGEADPEIRPNQAMAWGLGRQLAFEQPPRWGGLIDLPGTADDAAVTGVAAAIGGAGGEDELAIRSAGVYGRRLVRARLDGEPPVRTWNPKGTVLVTGGTGAIGSHVARWLARNGAQHLLLSSRRGDQAPGAGELHAELEELGAQVTIVASDMADRDSVEQLIADVPQDRPLTAVVHTAGVLQMFNAIADMSPAEFAECVAGKALGARHLDEVLGDTPLDAFVLSSSVTGIWGMGYQGAYAAGNAFLDIFAAERRARGHTVTSVAFGGWLGEGMVADGGSGEYSERVGLQRMEPDLAVSAMVQTVEHDETAVCVAPVDWDAHVPQFNATQTSRFLDDLPDAQPALRKARETPGNDSLDFATLSEDEREQKLLELVRAQAAAVLGLSGIDAVEPTQDIRALGLDSLTALELRNKLNAATGLRLPSTAVFSSPTPVKLTRVLLKKFKPAKADADRPVVQGS